LGALRCNPVKGLALGAIGVALGFRGVTGYCALYKKLGINTAKGKKGVQNGIKIEKTIYIQRSPAELYHYWRRLENLPKVMSHLECVERTNDRVSHWTAKAPAGQTVSWDAEIINEKENELIAWQSLEGSQVKTAGSVHFDETPNGGTNLKVSLQYLPPGGKAGAVAAKFLCADPDQEISDDLLRFKESMEQHSESACDRTDAMSHKPRFASAH
jgi:uncharacterized membrane protein